MKILMVSPECYPFAKVGGLGDVVGALPKKLASYGHDVRICLPLYGSIHPQGKRYDNVVVRLGGHNRICRLWEQSQDGLIYYFIEYQQYFSDSRIYIDGPNNGERFAFFCRAALDMCVNQQWIPDIIHCHDWTTGLIPIYLNTNAFEYNLNKAATVFTIHNLEHQGIFQPDLLAYAGIPFSEFRSDSVESLGCINFMKGALYHATKITTVSPTYAKEIQTSTLGCGLQHVLKFKAGDLIVILNGIDENIWDPETDPFLTEHYSLKNLKPKFLCKKNLRTQLNLPDNTGPILGIISRLYPQKGLDVFLDVAPYLLKNMQIQIVIIGSGDPNWEARCRALEQQFPNQVRTFIGYNGTLAHQVEAGCDLFLMPSRFEPCGLNQIYSMRYGPLPIVRATGGLVDTVDSLDETTGQGCGFIFSDLCPDAIYNTIGWACSVYYNKPEVFINMQRTAMAKDFSWNKSARKYEEVYHWTIQQRQQI